MDIKNKRKWLLLMIDIGCFFGVYIAIAFIAMHSSSSIAINREGYMLNLTIFLVCLIASRVIIRVYSNVWRYANSKAYLQMVIADSIGGIAALFITYSLNAQLQTYFGIWQSASVVALFDVLTLTSRFAYQQYYRHLNVSITDLNKIGVAIVGAGQIGSLLAEELLYNPSSHYRPICFIDTNNEKIGGRMSGLKVYAENEKTIELIKTLPVQEIFIALPNIDNAMAAKLHSFYSQTGCKVKMYDFPVKTSADENGENKRVLRELHIEDLLFRDSMKINNERSEQYYKDKCILVTGCGSIGSEICRQIAKLGPKKLVIFDIYENNAYDIQQELIRKHGDKLPLAVEIGSVRDRARLDTVFATYKPDIVFHAAAHKHVPLMEQSNCEAIKNNCIGTANTADMAEKHAVKKFILISTDKAVNPTNVMGASKRVCEMVIQCRTDSATSFAAVRFGNVLGSNGSVIPLFRKQIEKGGPITLTDKRIIRYFMTIPEASQLVMLAGAMANSGDLFVLNMGKPVKILDLAENMIRLSGLRPYEDIDIVEVGLRPGEKLYEELLIKDENLTKTDNDMIFIEHDTPLTREEMNANLQLLQQAVSVAENNGDSDAVRLALKKVVKTYCDPEEINRNAEESEEMKKSE
ncbi:MAG: polysaccharide biosynthesis protein [Clostridia bacterium]|nr:polysaccharide biosynthesis protein [Clostridia bacterium]